MLKRNKISPLMIVRSTLMLPAFALIVFGYSCTKNDRLAGEQQEVQGKLLQTDQLTELPEFPGGQEAMYKYIGEQLKYPSLAKEEGMQGTAVVSFVVDADGRIKKASVKNEIAEELATEAVRVVKDMPNWKPAQANGESVAAEMILPIRFALE